MNVLRHLIVWLSQSLAAPSSLLLANIWPSGLKSTCLTRPECSWSVCRHCQISVFVHLSATELVVRVACQTPSLPCPECHQPSTHLHGMYQRTIADLPCAGRNVFLILRVRKFFCRTPTCSHKIFTERLPGLVKS